MRVNFFEEFPNKKAFLKAKLIDFPSTIFIAAKSIKEFKKWRSELKKINSKLEAAYWPIINRSYWISSFSYNEDIQNLYNDLRANKEKNLKILLDLELPLNLKLYFRNLFSFGKNKKIIKRIFTEQKELGLEIYTAEYPFHNKIISKIFRWFGISYDLRVYPHKKIMMYYTSMLKGGYIKKVCKKAILKKKKLYGNNFEVALGTTAIGILGNEPKITYENLEKDLEFVKKSGINTVTIFRLEGLDKKYLKVIKKFL